MLRAGEGSWGHRGGEPSLDRAGEQGGEQPRAAGEGAVPRGLNKWGHEFRVIWPVPWSVSIPGSLPQASGQALACTTPGGC